MTFRLLPKEERFYDDFVALAEEIRRGASVLEEMLAPEQPLWDKADEIKEVEHKCDFLTHEIIQRLHRTFVTPLDREDIHGLARSLDDVMDAIDATGRDRPPVSNHAGAARGARADAHHHGLRRSDREGAESAGAAEGCGRAGRRDQSARERSGPRAPERRAAGCSKKSAIPCRS